MTRRLRLDRGSLGDVTRTPQGGLSVPAYLTRSGVFEYVADDGKTIREWRPSSEVFRAETLASLKAAPITLNHPPARVDTVNYRMFNKGHVGDDVKRDGDKTAATVYLQDAEIVRAVESGKREISCGYHIDTDETPGVVPAGEPDAGQQYDRVQRGILYNHVALVDHGRAGDAVRLRLDSIGDAILDGDNMADPIVKKIEVIGGVEFEVGSDPHRDARQRADAAQTTQRETAATLLKQRDDAVKVAQAEKKRADDATAKLASVVAGVKKELSPDRMDARARARIAVIEKAAAILGKDFKADGLTNDAIKAKVVEKFHAGVRLDAVDEKDRPTYLRGLWDAIKVDGKGSDRRDGATRPAVPAHLASAPAEPKDSGSTVRDARNDALAESSQRWQTPLAVPGGGARRNVGAMPNQSGQYETMK